LQKKIDVKVEFLKQFHAKHDKLKFFISIHKMLKWFGG
jgi:hypothetical protein